MPTGPLRLVVALVIAVLLFRAAAGAWRHRDVSLAVWRGIRLRHVAGAFGLVVAVAGVGALLLAVPPLRLGLGSLLDFSGNAVFVPLEEAAIRAGPAPSSGPDWVLALLATAFLAFLLVLLPWLAFIEEEIFRAGLEATGRVGEAWAALRFGLVHLVMLVPLAAALAISVAGYVYGRIYRGSHARAPSDGSGPVPVAVSDAYRPTRRARTVAHRVGRSADRRPRPVGAPVALSPAVQGAARAAHALDVVPTPLPSYRRQAAGVYASTIWHTTFNSIVVVTLWAAIMWQAVLGR